MADLVMPRLSDTMEEGTILRWLKADGDEIKRGDELVEIETDKANMIYESDLDGTLQTVAAEGDTLPVGQLIARVGAPADGAAAVGDGAAAGAVPEQAPSERAVASPAAATPAAETFVEAISEIAGGGAGSDAPAGDGARVKASPL
ncbi:MAG: lipoyl domain-containing protein, partial [Solirubrobacteraceae bacterium]